MFQENKVFTFLQQTQLYTYTTNKKAYDIIFLIFSLSNFLIRKSNISLPCSPITKSF